MCFQTPTARCVVLFLAERLGAYTNIYQNYHSVDNVRMKTLWTKLSLDNTISCATNSKLQWLMRASWESTEKP